MSARVVTEVRQLLNEPQPMMGEPDRHQALCRILQHLAYDIAGRDATEAECELVWRGGEVALDEVIATYEQEQLDTLYGKNVHNRKGQP